jgi:hypothetical protein
MVAVHPAPAFMARDYDEDEDDEVAPLDRLSQRVAASVQRLATGLEDRRNPRP